MTGQVSPQCLFTLLSEFVCRQDLRPFLWGFEVRKAGRGEEGSRWWFQILYVQHPDNTLLMCVTASVATTSLPTAPPSPHPSAAVTAPLPLLPGRLRLHQLGIGALRPGHKLGVGALLEDHSAVHDGDAVGVADCGEAVRDDQARAPNLSGEQEGGSGVGV